MLQAQNRSAASDPWEILLEQIRQAKNLPAPEAYRPEPGDPLERLRRRMRGEDVDAPEPAASALSPGAAKNAGAAGARQAPAGVEAQLGREVLAILGAAPLPGAARAAAAEVLSAQLYAHQNLPDEVAEGLRRVLGMLVTGQVD